MLSTRYTKSFFLFSLTVALALPVFAQSEQPATGGDKSRRLRFASQRPVEYMRLKVNDSAGALIHDSGDVAKSEITWSFVNDDGAMINSGLYDWTLIVKEPGKATALIKRGQFNLDNANELGNIA